MLKKGVFQTIGEGLHSYPRRITSDPVELRLLRPMQRLETNSHRGPGLGYKVYGRPPEPSDLPEMPEFDGLCGYRRIVLVEQKTLMLSS